ncbi:hypothetical protein IJ22_08750 [Paenibacillus naphthalenovorans]|uniref:Uncharacterized protein n=1 Tax=Paenibacillus naphthalenovorans TaxID=162209 RepID=A0A0U2U3Z0_9BACL|nr:hypothetical protein IJ22_08750 [Paenibacillus naphthalenovorans]SDH98767.1 hypothetical protein SAMN05421868_102140 [Paenibacillus naphthalenovorans]
MRGLLNGLILSLPLWGMILSAVQLILRLIEK